MNSRHLVTLLALFLTLSFAPSGNGDDVLDIEDEELERCLVIDDSAFKDLEASFGRMVASVSDMVGTQMFFKSCEHGRYLVQIEEIELFRDRHGAFPQIGRLAGSVVWGEVPWKTVDVDRREQFAKLGMEPMETFESFTMGGLGSKDLIDVESMKLSTIHVNEFEFLVMRGLEGSERASGSRISVAPSELDELECISYVEFDCVNFACSSTCTDSGGDCNCPGLGFCSSWPMVRCMNINCDATCVVNNPIGFLTWCSCE